MTLQLSREDYWEQIWRADFTALPGILPNSHFPIDEQICPILPESHILAVICESPSAKPTWRWAGICNQRLNTGITFGGIFDTNANPARQSIYLRRLTLLVFPKLTDDYAISFEVPKWFKDIRYTLFQFTGPVDGDDCAALINAQGERNETNYLQLQTSVDRLQQDIERLLP